MNDKALHDFYTNMLINQPMRRIAPRAIRAWQWTAGLTNLIFFAVPALYLTANGTDDSIHVRIGVALAVVALVWWLLNVCLFPYIRWKRWRYSVDKHQIDLKRGVFVIRRTLIPLSRVQHVDTRQGPMLRWYSLASVTISTAATTHEIPALDEETADEVRNIISHYARLAEEDV